MPAHRFNIAFGQLLPELLGRHPVGARQFRIFDAESFYLVQRPGHVLVELVAQAVQLKPDRTFEIHSYARRSCVAEWAASEKHGEETARTNEKTESCFHGPSLTRKPVPMEA